MTPFSSTLIGFPAVLPLVGVFGEAHYEDLAVKRRDGKPQRCIATGCGHLFPKHFGQAAPRHEVTCPGCLAWKRWQETRSGLASLYDPGSDDEETAMILRSPK